MNTTKNEVKKMTFSEICILFCNHNEDNGVTTQFGDTEHRIKAVIVFKQGPWFNAEYSEESRSYSFVSDNKFFIAGMGGNSIFGDCLDGTEHGVRLDKYLGKWEIDYCYLTK